MSIKQGSRIIAGSGGGIANYDGKSITENSADELQTVGVINQNNPTNAIKTWTGTKAQYDAIVTKDINTEYFCTDNGEIYLGDVKIGSGGGLEIGDIGFTPLGIDETENKRRYLNGQVISQTQFQSFTTKLKAAVQTYPNLATSEENWQAEVTNSKLGQCGKFVIDDVAGTIRLPKVVNINGLQDLALMGSIKSESLPNIEGTSSVNALNTGTTGAFYTVNKQIALYGSTVQGIALNFDASRSSSTYQDNAPVQQEAIQYPYFIQVATGVETSVDVTREIELNNPFSLLDYKWSEYELNNASWLLSNGAFHSGATYVAVYELLLKIKNGTETKAGVSVKLSTEAYTDTDFVINTADTTFRLPIKVKLASGNRVAGNGGNLNVGGSSSALPLYTNNSSTVQTDYYATTLRNLQLTTDPTKSGIETSANGLKLYFYVGETIQDANLINVGNVFEQLATKTDSVQAAAASMPSSRYIDLTLGASGATYTAPANGWFYFNKVKGTGTYTAILLGENATFENTTRCEVKENNQNPNCELPCTFQIEKGEKVTVLYAANGVTRAFRFIYAEGEN